MKWEMGKEKLIILNEMYVFVTLQADRLIMRNNKRNCEGGILCWGKKKGGDFFFFLGVF